MLGFKRFETAAVTIRGIELAAKIKKHQFNVKAIIGKGTTAPELWAAVLKQAITDARQKQKQKAAVKWIQSDEWHVGSFNWCCSIFELSPAWVRSKLTVTLKCKKNARLNMDNGQDNGSRELLPKGMRNPVPICPPPPPAKVPDINPSNSGLQWLKAQLEKFESRLKQAEVEVERLKPIVANIKGTIEAIQLQATVKAEPQPVSGLPRKAPDQTITEAIKGILTAAPEPLKYRELARSVFEIKDESDWEKARR